MLVIARENPDVVISGALFVGKDTTNDNAFPVDIYGDIKNHASAAASILQFSARATDYRPSEQGVDSKKGYSLFQQKAASFPGFHSTREETKDVSLDGTLIQLEQAVRDAYPSNDASLIARNLRDLIPGFVQNNDLKEWLLSLIVIRKPANSDIVMVEVVELRLTLESDESQTTYIPKQKARLSTSEFRVLSATLTQNRDRFAELIPVATVQHVIQYFTSPKVFGEPKGMLEGESRSCGQETTPFSSRLQQVRLARWFDI